MILKKIVDLIYGTKSIVRKFEVNNPNEKVLAADASKGIMTTSNDEVKYGTNWINSQRAVLMLTNNRIISGKWEIDLGNISKINLIKISSIFGSGQVLKIETKDDKHYQFGMQINPDWVNQQTIPLNFEKGKIKYSVFSIIIRLIALALILRWLYDIIID